MRVGLIVRKWCFYCSNNNSRIIDAHSNEKLLIFAVNSRFAAIFTLHLAVPEADEVEMRSISKRTNFFYCGKFNFFIWSNFSSFLKRYGFILFCLLDLEGSNLQSSHTNNRFRLDLLKYILHL